MATPDTPDTTAPPKHLGHRRCLTWLKTQGVTTAGKKGKRIVHRRDRQLTRKTLQTLSYN